MKRPRIAVSGASSFTGTWIAIALQEAGFEVLAHCAETQDQLRGLPQQRARLLENHRISLTLGIRAEDGGMSAWAKEQKPGLWVHHHHWMADFRSPRYDLSAASRVTIKPLPELLETLAASGCQGLVQTGSYFEPGEGGVDSSEERITPYAFSKKAVWEALGEECSRQNLALSKIVVPDPVGPLENEDRLIPAMIRAAHNCEQLVLAAPGASADRLPVRTLGQVYAEEAKALLEGSSGISRPSGWVGTNRNWVDFVNKELLQKRLKLPALTTVPPPLPLPSPPDRENPLEERLSIDWEAAWDDYAHILGVAPN